MSILFQCICTNYSWYQKEKKGGSGWFFGCHDKCMSPHPLSWKWPRSPTICYNESVVAEFVFDIRIEFSAQEKHRYPKWKHGLRGQTASEVVFDLRFELLDLKNLWIHTHIAIIGHSPWGQVLVKIKGSSKSKEAPLMLAVFQKTSHSRLWLVPFSIRSNFKIVTR